eukprot:SM006198S19829  [mRNA]  locus=s6198:214:882:+ [translate_table: standard]
MAAHLRLPAGAVRLVGLADDEAGALWAADAVVYASLRPAAGGLPGHLATALALGRPVALPQLPHLEQWVDDATAVLFYPAGSESQLARLLQRALEPAGTARGGPH